MALTPKKPSLFERLGHFFTSAFYGKQMKDHQKDIDSLHKEESTQKWDSFADKTKDPSFVKAVQNDPRSDNKLKMHAERLNQLHSSKKVGLVQGSRGRTYQISILSTGDYGCTCNDWRYKGSVTPGYQCKHIKEYVVRSRHGNKT